MGIAGSVVDHAFWEKWLGMRVEAIDMTEFIGRMNKDQFDTEEFETALTWVRKNCPEGDDCNADDQTRSREQLDSEWSDGVKMALIARDGIPIMKPFWEITDDEVKKCLEATTWHPSITEYFPGGGMSTRYCTRGGMPSTMTRINLVAGLGPALQIAEGVTVELPEKVHDVLDQRTNPMWPTTWFAPELNGAAHSRRRTK